MGISNIYRLGVAKTEKFRKDTQTCIFQRGSISFPNHFFGGSKRCISGSMNLFLWREPISIQPSQSTTLQCFGRAQCMGEFPIIFVSPLGWWNKIPGSLEVKIFMTVEQPPHMYMGTFSTYVHLADACWSVWSFYYIIPFTLPSTMPMHPTWVSFHFALRLRIMSPKNWLNSWAPKNSPAKYRFIRPDPLEGPMAFLLRVGHFSTGSHDGTT